jgi:hypothetical protein
VYKPRLFMTGLASSAGNGEIRQHKAYPAAGEEPNHQKPPWLST